MKGPTGVDWLRRISDCEAVSLLDDEPLLWISIEDRLDSANEIAIKLMDKVRQGTIRKGDFPLLTEVYGLYGPTSCTRKTSYSSLI
jgi:hypothetical protein